MSARLIVVALAVCGIAVAGACGSSDPTNGTEPPPPAGKTEFKVFITTADFDGNIQAAGGRSTGIASADALCMADAGKPAGGATYKAMLVDGVSRVACLTRMCGGGASEHVDWVFKAGGKYYRADGTTLIFTADANGVFDFESSGRERFGPAGRPYWTGLNEGVAAWRTVSNQICDRWTNATAVGDFGSTDFSGWGAIGGGAQSCSARKHLVCVEQ